MALEIKFLRTTKDFLDFAKELGNDSPVKRMLHAAEAASCNTVVIETEYKDEEYEKEFELFYVKVFKSKPPSEVIRVHLFEGFLAGTEKDDLEASKDKYFGYFTLRPLKTRRVSDAFISQQVIIDEESRFVFLTCKMTKEVDINGVKFEVVGFPYIQQDSRIAACAQCSIRIISQFLAWKQKKKNALTAPEITEKVKAISNAISPDASRQIPTNGLTEAQMKAALNYLECDPILYNYTLLKQEELYNKHPEQIIYRYIESGLPVIVGIYTARAKHAVVVVGHTFNPDLWWRYASEPYYQVPRSGTDPTRNDIKYHSSVDWIQNFIIQDDNLGPYYFMNKELLQNNISSIFVPMPYNVYLYAEEAEIKAYDTIYKQHIQNVFDQAIIELERTASPNLDWLNLFYDFWTRQDLILRTYLRRSENLKRDVDKFTRSAPVKDAILRTSMPKYVWVVEISWPDIFSHLRKKCGEVILDATADATSDSATLFMHVPGIFMEKNDTRGTQFVTVLEDDQPFRHLYRKKVPIPKKLPKGQIA